MDKNLLNLTGNVKISDSNSVITSEDMDYNTKTKTAVSNTPFKLIYDKTFVVTGNEGKADMLTEKIIGHKVKIVSAENEEFTADRIDGDMKEMRFDFIGNAKEKCWIQTKKQEKLYL